MRELHAGNNFESQDPVQAHFGLAAAQLVDKVRVAWPDGEQTTLPGQTADQELVIDYPAPR